MALLGFFTSQGLPSLHPSRKLLPYNMTFSLLHSNLLTKGTLMNLKAFRPQRLSVFPEGMLPCLVFLTDGLCSLFTQ
jgi:hypothetical protein